ncbi:Crp/Fnr family transcriptional regulator [Niabella yanshanensis]|uniref:Crp/Fnr family transcriptional regulator n=1 Tax=Niabella yanshanensis TaxID=577386 RepID=A0ABZ0W959_9BACT|nr:Crp/Fnr family transcriptional regulator [Niabella yanshanensis]WQD38685.1 Crp/Fnr family transcriptional regulator [Niabella yanshanensis]
MNGLIEYFSGGTVLTEQARQDLLDSTKVKSFRKGTSLLKEGHVAQYLYFIEEGLLKLSFTRNGKEFIMRFFPENSLCTGLDSFLTKTRSGYGLVALETTMVHYISHRDIDHLCRKHHCVETAFRQFLGMASVNMMARVSEMLEEDAIRRYENFLQQNSSLLQRISLGDLSGYLGIAQVSLSRIRAKR